MIATHLRAWLLSGTGVLAASVAALVLVRPPW